MEMITTVNFLGSWSKTNVDHILMLVQWQLRFFEVKVNHKKCLSGYNSSLPSASGNSGATIPSSPSPAIAIQIEVSILNTTITLILESDH